MLSVPLGLLSLELGDDLSLIPSLPDPVAVLLRLEYRGAPEPLGVHVAQVGGAQRDLEERHEAPKQGDGSRRADDEREGWCVPLRDGVELNARARAETCAGWWGGGVVGE